MALQGLLQTAENEVYTSIVVGAKAGDATMPPVSFLCRNYLTPEERSAAGEYAVPGQFLSDANKNCYQFKADGSQ